MILKEEPVGERYGQRIFPSACFRPMKKARFSIVSLNGDEKGVAMVWLATVMVLL